MDTQKNGSTNHHEECRHWMCHGHWGGMMAVRIILALVIAFVIFAIGVKVGEIKAELYGTGGWYGRDYYGGYGGYPMPMMRYYNYGNYGTPGATAPSAGTTK